jgi:hypothetical protein
MLSNNQSWTGTNYHSRHKRGELHKLHMNRHCTLTSNSQNSLGTNYRSGRKRPGAATHEPWLHVDEQQSEKDWHDSPFWAQAQGATHEPLVHDDEQQSEYARHELPFGTQTGVGSTQAPLVHCDEQQL